jgi:hypothetical protein
MKSNYLIQLNIFLVKIFIYFIDSTKNFFILVKKTKKRTSTWTKVSINCRDSHILCIEQERLSIAAYEIQQTHLERERMKANAMVALDNLQVSLD